LICDEIQTGMGRTGRLFGHEHGRTAPDVVTLAKGLANGVPIGACLAREVPRPRSSGPGSHGSTFGGNPLACRAARAVLETIVADDLIANAAEQGAYLLDGFRNALATSRASSRFAGGV
jgi:acetylornithine/N-succinyldiaminopimelate aminotransferase